MAAKGATAGRTKEAIAAAINNDRFIVVLISAHPVGGLCGRSAFSHEPRLNESSPDPYAFVMKNAPPTKVDGACVGRTTVA